MMKVYLAPQITLCTFAREDVLQTSKDVFGEDLCDWLLERQLYGGDGL